MLSEQFVCSREGGVVEDIRIPFQHVTNSGTQFGESGFLLFLLLGPQPIGVLGVM